MTHPVMQDIVPRRPAGKPALSPFLTRRMKGPEEPPLLPPKAANDRPPRRRGLILTTLFAALTIVAGLALTAALASVTLNVTPKNESLPLDLSFEVMEKGAGLTFKTAVVDLGEMSVTALAKKTENVTRPASGTVVVYNTGGGPQTLVGDERDVRRQTRFATPEGKIFRIHRTLVVPAAKNGNPGAAEAVVYADEAGEGGNIGFADFTLPGLKGTPQYERIYARAKTEIRGGASGSAVVAAEEDLVAARAALSALMKETVGRALSSQVPETFILYPDAVILGIEEDEGNVRPGEKVAAAGEKGEFVFKGSAKATAYLLPRAALETALLKRLRPTEASLLRVHNLEELNFSLRPKGEATEALAFNLRGAARVVWKIDGPTMAKEVALGEKGSVAAVFASNPAVKKVEIMYRPGWWRRLPSDPGRIYIEERLE